jgi:predicted metal-dependent enzyme (double-stranded beta helix superfamily)
MAELVNLQSADKHLEQCRALLEELIKQFDSSRGKVWSKEQMDYLHLMHRAIDNLRLCVSHTLHNNRDGRGTVKGGRG